MSSGSGSVILWEPLISMSTFITDSLLMPACSKSFDAWDPFSSKTAKKICSILTYSSLIFVASEKAVSSSFFVLWDMKTSPAPVITGNRSMIGVKSCIIRSADTPSFPTIDTAMPSGSLSMAYKRCSGSICWLLWFEASEWAF